MVDRHCSLAAHRVPAAVYINALITSMVRRLGAAIRGEVDSDHACSFEAP